jgi:hypothetical protein
MLGGLNWRSFKSLAAFKRVAIASAIASTLPLLNEASWINFKAETGAACDGIVDDTQKLINLLADIPSAGGPATIWLTGTPLLSSTVTLSKRVKLIWDGGLGLQSGSRPLCYFIKKSTMTTAALEFSGAGAQGAIMEGGGVVAQVGNVGPNIVIKANSVSLRDVYSEGAGTYCYYVDGSVNNANHWKLDNCRAYAAGSHGYYFDGATAGGNANAGTAIHCMAQNCVGDGFNSNFAFWNSFISCSADGNTGYGAHFQNGVDNKVDSGDFEGNTAGTIKVDAGERVLTIIQKNSSFAITDNGYFTRRVDRYVNKRAAFTPVIQGSTGATKNVTAVTIAGTVATITSAAHGYANGDSVHQYGGGWPNSNLLGGFQISNVTANTYDITFRTDRSSVAPVTAAGLVGATTQQCGVASVAEGWYVMRDGECKLKIRLTMTAKTNITGTVQLVLPFATDNISANIFAQAHPTYYTGVTHAGKLEIAGVQNGGDSMNFFDTISGAPGAAAQFNAAGLAAATDFIIEGEFFTQLAN